MWHTLHKWAPIFFVNSSPLIIFLKIHRKRTNLFLYNDSKKSHILKDNHHITVHVKTKKTQNIFIINNQKKILNNGKFMCINDGQVSISSTFLRTNFFVRMSFWQLFLVTFWLWQKSRMKNARRKRWWNWRQIVRIWSLEKSHLSY